MAFGWKDFVKSLNPVESFKRVKHAFTDRDGDVGLTDLITNPVKFEQDYREDKQAIETARTTGVDEVLKANRDNDFSEQAILQSDYNDYWDDSDFLRNYSTRDSWKPTEDRLFVNPLELVDGKRSYVNGKEYGDQLFPFWKEIWSVLSL